MPSRPAPRMLSSPAAAATGAAPLPGFIQMYGGPAAPSGWLLCDGASYATAAYPALFAALGYAFGGAGANFNVPDLRSRSPVGAAAAALPGLTPRALGASGGAETVALAGAQMPVHSHGITDPGHTHVQDPHQHDLRVYAADPAHGHLSERVAGSPAPDIVGGAATTDPATATNQTALTGVSVNPAGGGAAHENMHPWLALTFIIKT